MAGWVRVPAVLSRPAVDSVADAVWAYFAGRGIDRARRETWPVGLVTKHQALKKARVFDAFGASPATADAITKVVGERSWDGGPWGPALVTFPQPGPWTVPHKIWHFDLPGRGDPDRIDVVRLFGYVSDVVPQGGGTLIVEGSHELVRRMVAESPGQDAGSSSDIRKRLFRSHPWFQALGHEGGEARTAQFMRDGDEVDGVRVRVAELTADAGDVVAMHPWTLHNFSMNVADQPRLMVTHSAYRHGVNPFA